eukprot:GHVT01061895.1.p2 GENE.GHVT01061895.1~~GHVT01061895.1.p2  ORF type:complete len:616 (+),score=68.46 GHVT01061895.1:4960-6807(+)
MSEFLLHGFVAPMRRTSVLNPNQMLEWTLKQQEVSAPWRIPPMGFLGAPTSLLSNFPYHLITVAIISTPGKESKMARAALRSSGSWLSQLCNVSLAFREPRMVSGSLPSRMKSPKTAGDAKLRPVGCDRPYFFAIPGQLVDALLIRERSELLREVEEHNDVLILRLPTRGRPVEHRGEKHNETDKPQFAKYRGEFDERNEDECVRAREGRGRTHSPINRLNVFNTVKSKHLRSCGKRKPRHSEFENLLLSIREVPYLNQMQSYKPVSCGYSSSSCSFSPFSSCPSFPSCCSSSCFPPYSSSDASLANKVSRRRNKADPLPRSSQFDFSVRDVVTDRPMAHRWPSISSNMRLSTKTTAKHALPHGATPSAPDAASLSSLPRKGIAGVPFVFRPHRPTGRFPRDVFGSSKIRRPTASSANPGASNDTPSNRKARTRKIQRKSAVAHATGSDFLALLDAFAASATSFFMCVNDNVWVDVEALQLDKLLPSSWLMASRWGSPDKFRSRYSNSALVPQLEGGFLTTHEVIRTISARPMGDVWRCGGSFHACLSVVTFPLSLNRLNWEEASADTFQAKCKKNQMDKLHKLQILTGVDPKMMENLSTSFEHTMLKLCDVTPN